MALLFVYVPVCRFASHPIQIPHISKEIGPLAPSLNLRGQARVRVGNYATGSRETPAHVPRKGDQRS